MSAAPTTVARFTAIQRRGLRLIGDGAYIPSLDIRRMVGALCFLYKLHFSTGPDMLLTLLPPRATNTSRHSRRTQRHPSHQFQLTSTPPLLRVRNDVLRSFPDAVVEVWNQAAPAVRSAEPANKERTAKRRSAPTCALPAGIGQRTGLPFHNDCIIAA